MNVCAWLSVLIDRGHGNIKDNKTTNTILFTADYTESKRMMKYLLMTIVLLEILTLASSMILPSDDEGIEEVNNWGPIRKNYVLKNFLRKRTPAGFWVIF